MNNETMTVIEHVRAIIDSCDILQIAARIGLAPDAQNRARCFAGREHSESTLILDSETQTFRCIEPSCRIHGNVVDLVQEMEKRSFRDAVNLLAEFAGAEPVQESKELNQYDRVRSCLRAAARLYALNLPLAMPYLESRGISRPTGERYLAGMTLGKEYLRQALHAQGFEESVMAEAGLLNQYGQDLFRDRIVVPLRVSGEVTGFYGRALRDEDEVRHLRMGNNRVIIGDAPFNWNPRCEEIIAVEGVFDALALMEHGHTNAVATFGTQGFSTRQGKELLGKSQTRKVYVCFDGDAAGRNAGIKRAYELEDMDKEVRMIELGHQDPNEFILEHGADEFENRLSKSLSPVRFQIQTLDDGLGSEDKIAQLERVFRRVKDMPPLERETVVKTIAAKLKVGKRVVEEHIASINAAEEEALRHLDLSDKRIIHPALDMADGTLLMTVSQPLTNPETGAMEWVPYLVTSKRELFPLESKELLKRGYVTTVTGMGDAARYSGGVIKDFLTGNVCGDFIATFRAIHTLLTRNVDFPDENAHAFLTCWIIGTYFHPMFNYYPYIHFTGTKNVGKSKTMKLMSCICFNGVMSVSISPASQYRIIEALRPTLFMDETEDLKDKGFSDKRALLLGGYEAGSSVLRCEKDRDNFKVRRMGNFGPRAFASIEGLEDTLASRTVQITMQRSFNPEIKEKEVTLSNPEFQKIRDDLFLVTMTYASTVARVYEEITRPETAEFGDREFNLFKPILAIGRASGMQGVEERLIEFQNASYLNKVAEYNHSAPENVLLRFLLEVVPEEGYYRSDELHVSFVHHLKTNGIELNLMVTKAFLGTLMKKLGIVCESRRSPDRTCTVYLLKRKVLLRVAENYQAN